MTPDEIKAVLKKNAVKGLVAFHEQGDRKWKTSDSPTEGGDAKRSVEQTKIEDEARETPISTKTKRAKSEATTRTDSKNLDDDSDG